MHCARKLRTSSRLTLAKLTVFMNQSRASCVYWPTSMREPSGSRIYPRHSRPSGLGNGSIRKNAPLSPLVAGPDVGDTQIKDAIDSVQIRRCFTKDLWLIESRATAATENDPRIRQLDVAGIFWLDRFPAKNSAIEVPRVFPGPHREDSELRRSLPVQSARWVDSCGVSCC